MFETIYLKYMLMKKRILIDATTASRRIDGLTQYILNTALYLDTSKAAYTMIFRRGECPENYAEWFAEKDIATEEVDIRPIGPVRDFQFACWLSKNEKRFDAAFFPSNQFPVATSLPCVYTVHDLIYEEFPEQLGKLSGLKRWYLHWNVHKGLKKAKRVIAVSEYTKREIKKYHPNVDEGKIEVVYEGWEHLRNVRPALYTAPFEHYILYVGSSRGHKNLNRLIDAAGILKDRLPEGWGVVIAGNNSMFTREQKTKICNVNAGRKVIELTGWLSEEELAGCFSRASLFVFPSLSEGFGIPVLEAYYYGIPLLLSNHASLPEVAGDAAIYFNPYDADDIARKLLEAIFADHGKLIETQKRQLGLYSWIKTAEKVDNLLLNL